MTTKKRWGLIHHTIKKSSREMVDFDYLSELSEEELDWLDKFSREYYNDDFAHADRLHDTPEQKRKRHNCHNERRRDMWNYYRRMPYDYTDMAIKKDGGEDE